jgi:hypothetical protein
VNRPTLSPVEIAHRRDRLIDIACAAGALVISTAIAVRAILTMASELMP